MSVTPTAPRAFLLTDIQSKMANITTSGATVVCVVIVPHFFQDGLLKDIAVHAANAGDARAVLSSKIARALPQYSRNSTKQDSRALPNPELPNECPINKLTKKEIEL